MHLFPYGLVKIAEKYSENIVVKLEMAPPDESMMKYDDIVVQYCQDNVRVKESYVIAVAKFSKVVCLRTKRQIPSSNTIPGYCRTLLRKLLKEVCLKTKDSRFRVTFSGQSHNK